MSNNYGDLGPSTGDIVGVSDHHGPAFASPAVFPEAMDFGGALEALDEGHKVKRRGWINQWLTYDERRKRLAPLNPFVHHLNAGSWQAAYVPSWQDIDAEDWEIVE